MTHFESGQKVIITQPASRQRRPLKGYTGTVGRLRIVDVCAWVSMDKHLPDGFHEFPEFVTPYANFGKPKRDPRRNHILMYPSECELRSKSKASTGSE